MRKKFLCFFIAFLFVAFCFVYPQRRIFLSNEEFSQELLQKISIEERDALSDICKGLFYTSAFGYTLFGDKPISLICDAGRIYENEELSFFQKHLFILAKRYEKRLNAPHFAIVVESFTPISFIYLVNKKAFINAVQENIAIFRGILGESITPRGLLESVLDKNYGFEKSLKGNHALFGILFGFGVENALRFDRRDQLEPLWLCRRFPPWNGTQNQNSMHDEDIMEPNWRKACVVRGLDIMKPPEKIAPTIEFPTVQDELLDLNRKLVPVAGANEPQAVLRSIPLPAFGGDPDSRETRELAEKYRAQRVILMKILAENGFIEKVLEKFYSTDGD